MAINEANRIDETREVRVLRSTSLASANDPGHVLLAPWGRVESTNGYFIVDEEAARLTEEAFAEHGTDLPIDYEHQTLGGVYSSPSGTAPAAGWIKRIISEPGEGLFAEIEWTAEARQMLASKQYRYLSPVAIVRKTDRKLVSVHSAALTNKPAIIGMQPIVNQIEKPAQEPELEPLVLLRAELNLPLDTQPEQVLLAASRRLVDLQREAAGRHVAQRVGEAIQAGKLVAAQRAWAEAMVGREEDLFDEWLRTAPVVVSCGATVPPEGDSHERRQQAAASRARAEFKDNPVLVGLTTEEAYVEDAMRSAVA